MPRPTRWWPRSRRRAARRSPNYNSVAEAKSAANIVKTAVDSFGTVDIVVNNAGVLRDKTFHNMTVEDFDFVVKVHFLGTAYVTHAAWPILRAKAYGRVVVTSSNSGIYGNFGQANYGGAKLAVVGFMNALRLEGQKYNIMVNALAPVAGTRMTESLMTPEMLAKIRPEFVSPMVAYLCSEQCQRTGEIWSAGAGYFARIEYREAPGLRIKGRAPTRRGRGRQHRQDRRPLDQQRLPDLDRGGAGGGGWLNARPSRGRRVRGSRSSTGWLHEGRLDRRRRRASIDQLMNRAVAAGRADVARSISACSSSIRSSLAMGYMWRRGEPVRRRCPRLHGIQFTPAYIGSPMQEVREQGRTVRYRLDELPEQHHAVLHELKADGGTDYFALPMRIRRDGPHRPSLTFATDRRERLLRRATSPSSRRLVDMMAPVAEMPYRAQRRRDGDQHLSRPHGRRAAS